MQVASNASSPTETEPQDREELTPIDNIAASHSNVSPHPELQSDADVTALSAEMKRRVSMLDSIGEETATTEPESEPGAARLRMYLSDTQLLCRAYKERLTQLQLSLMWLNQSQRSMCKLTKM